MRELQSKKRLKRGDRYWPFCAFEQAIVNCMEFWPTDTKISEQLTI